MAATNKAEIPWGHSSIPQLLGIKQQQERPESHSPGAELAGE